VHEAQVTEPRQDCRIEQEHDRLNTECICGPIAFAPAVAGGAVVGALVGAVVYAARRSAGERAHRTKVPRSIDMRGVGLML
jgi:hypothetical protein